MKPDRSVKEVLQQLRLHFIRAWSSPGDLWRPDKVIGKIESMIDEDERRQKQK